METAKTDRVDSGGGGKSKEVRASEDALVALKVYKPQKIDRQALITSLSSK